MGETLKPCPFCGGSAQTEYIRDGRRAICQSCSAAGPPEFNGRLDQPSADSRAAEEWNHRAATHEEVERLRALLETIVANAELQPDVRMGGTADCYAVPLDDIDTTRAALQQGGDDG